MVAPLGNQYWMRRDPETGHRPLKVEDPEKLWEMACAYFEWAASNPLEEEVAMGSKDGPVRITLSKMRALTLKAMCLYIDVGWDAFNEYRKRPAFKDVCQRIDDVIFTQKFEGAAAGLLNHSIIARDLGLVEKTQAEVSGPNGGPIATIDAKKLSKAQLEALASIRIPTDRG